MAHKRAQHKIQLDARTHIFQDIAYTATYLYRYIYFNGRVPINYGAFTLEIEKSGQAETLHSINGLRSSLESFNLNSDRASSPEDYGLRGAAVAKSKAHFKCRKQIEKERKNPSS